jgi:hypothetical protein
VTAEPRPTGPDQEAIILTIRHLWPDTDVVTTAGATFFSLDPDKHWPNFATIVSTDDFDTASNLSRPGVFRLNIGLGRATFQRLVGSIAEPDYAALDRLLPHPVYARQHWVSILNPSDETFRDLALPLLIEAHDRLAMRRERRTAAGPDG